MVTSAPQIPFYLGQNDTGENLDINLLSGTPAAPYVIPGAASAVLYLASDPTFTTVIVSAGTMSIVSAPAGTVRYVTGTVAGDTATAGRFYGRVVLTLAGGAVLSWPNAPNDPTDASSQPYFEVIISRLP